MTKGNEYNENRKRKALELQAMEAIKDEQTCSFRPARIAHYESTTSNELPIEARSSVWQKRREEKLTKQRQELQRRAEDELLREGFQLKASETKISKDKNRSNFSRESSKGSPEWNSMKKTFKGDYTPKKATLTDEDYMNIRLDCIRRSIEKQMSYVDSHRSRSKSKD